MSECSVMILFCMSVNFSFPLRWPMFCAPLEQYFHLNSLQAFVQRRNETLAPAYAHALQGFCTFCFHNLHTSPICSSLFGLEIKEMSSKMSDFFPLFSDVFPYISDISLKNSNISVFLSPNDRWRSRLFKLPFSPIFCLFSVAQPGYSENMFKNVR